jgi:hypothetical protein
VVKRWVWLSAIVLLAVSGCMGRGAASRAQLPQPTNFAQWLAIVVVVAGLWWIGLKILRG